NSVVCALTLLIFASPANLHAQAVAANSQNSCFAIRVRLNGKLIDGPQTITFKTKEHETSVALEGGCFSVPSTLLKGKTIDVFFTLPGNRVYLSSILTG